MKLKFRLFDFDFDSEVDKSKPNNKKSSKIREILRTLFIGLATSIIIELLKLLINSLFSL